MKQRGKAEETINGLEELINALIADKAELARIATAYQDELVAQRISESDIKYVTETVVPLAKKLSLSGAANSSQQNEQMLDALSSLLSVETVSVLQILGFNFRQAIGQPLTQLVENAILSKSPAVRSSAEEIKALELKRENLVYEVALNADATGRLNKFLGR